MVVSIDDIRARKEIRVAHTSPQHGILERPPETEILAAYAFTGSDQAARAALEQLRGIAGRELAASVDALTPVTDRGQVFTETGELGYQNGWNTGDLTITVALSGQGFAALGIASQNRPQDLHEVPWPDIGGLPVKPDPGHLLVQVCSDIPYVAEHAQRRIEFGLRAALSPVWSVSGQQRYRDHARPGAAGGARALNGFIDGTANLHPATNDDDYNLVFVDPANVGDYPPNPPSGPQLIGPYGPTPSAPGPTFPPLSPVPTSEPAWTKDGTYLCVQAIELKTDTWDTATTAAQEQTIGRWKDSGASLDLADDPTNRNLPPAFATNQGQTTVATKSHIRSTNPHGPGDQLRGVFRRGYPFVIADGTSPTRRGLIFQSFSRSISPQIEFVLRAWMFNANFPTQGAGVDQLIQFFSRTLCGGYYFVPPLTAAHDPVSWAIPTP
jgi:Dyp-type peroxidase family